MCGDMFLIYKNCPDDESHEGFEGYHRTLLDIRRAVEGSALVQNRMCPERLEEGQQTGRWRWCTKDNRNKMMLDIQYRRDPANRYLVDDGEGCYVYNCQNCAKVIYWEGTNHHSLYEATMRQDLARRLMKNGDLVDLWIRCRRKMGPQQKTTPLMIRVIEAEGEHPEQELYLSWGKFEHYEMLPATTAKAKKQFKKLCDNAERAAQQVGEGSGAAKSPEETAGSSRGLEGDNMNEGDADYEDDEDYEDNESEDDGENEEGNENAARPNAGPSTESEAEASTRPQGGAADSGQDVNLFPPLDISDSDRDRQPPRPWRPGRLGNNQETGTSESDLENAYGLGSKKH